MKISQKQLRLIEIIENNGFMFRREINKSTYPDSMIDSLVNKGLICEFKGKLISSTKESKQ